MTAAGFEGDPSDDDLVPEDWPTFYTQVPVWVLLSGCTAQAYRLYAFLAEHINSRTPGRRIAWPKGDAIARALGLKDYRKAARYWAELQDLGAIRIEEIRYAGGMRRRNRYHVRFNPPANYAGLLSLSDFYTAHPDVRTPRTSPTRTTSGEETADHRGGAQKGTSGGARPGVTDGALNGTAQPDQHQLHPGQPETTAPAARSAVDARRAPAPSTGVTQGGVAASGNAKASAPTARRSPASPRRPDSGRVTRAQREDLRRIEASLPAELRDLLPARRPRPVREAMLAALKQRTWQQIAERAERRWYAWGFAAAADTSTGGSGLTSPVGVTIALCQEGECPDPRCEDGTNVDTARSCPRCAERRTDRRRPTAPTTAPDSHRQPADDASPPAPDPSGPPALRLTPPPAPAPPATPVTACTGWDATPCGRNSPSTGGLCTRCRVQALHAAPGASPHTPDSSSHPSSHSA